MSQLDQAFDASAFREQGHALIDTLANYLASCQERQDMPVLPWVAPDESFAFWEEASKEGTTSFEALTSQVLGQAIHTHHPRFVGHQVVPPAPAAALADLLGSFLNNSMAVYEMGPVGTSMEHWLMQWLGGYAGWGKQADGVMVFGGSIGNLTALLAARQVQAPFDTWKEGAKGGPQLAIMVSEEAHYCVARSAQIMGLGTEGVIKVPADANMRMRPEALYECYAKAISDGKHIIAVVGSACTTSTGSFDPLEEIGTFAQEKGIWFHIDGAHGGSALLSPKYKHLLKGIEKADSIVIDFHKMMLCPALTTAVVFKKPAHSYASFSQTAAYLLSEESNIWYDVASRTIECTKKSMSFKPYFLLRLYGEGIFAEYVERMYDLGHDFAQLIEKSPDFELLMPPSCNIVCFRYLPKNNMSIEEANLLNTHIRQSMIENGRFYLVHTVVKGKRYLRTALMNAQTQLNDLEELLQEVRTVAAGF